MAGRDEQTYGFRKDDAEGLINLLELGDGESVGRNPKQVTGIIIMTPSGGIPARSGATVGKANCTIYRITSSDVLESTGVQVSVVNIAAEAVSGSVYGQAKRAAGRWVIDYEECS